MEYKIAIEQLVNNYGIEVLKNPYLSLAILSDYIGFSIEGKEYLHAFYLINKNINIIEVLQENTLENARKLFKEAYKNLSSEIQYRTFTSCINPISKITHPNEYISSQNNSENNDIKIKQNVTTIIRQNKVKTGIDYNKISYYIISSISNNIFVRKSIDNKAHVCIPKINSADVIDKYSMLNNNELLINVSTGTQNVFIELPTKALTHLNIHTTSGNIVLEDLGKKMDDVVLYSYSGKIVLNIKAKNLKCETKSGDIVVERKCHHINVKSVSSKVRYVLETDKNELAKFELLSKSGIVSTPFSKRKSKKKTSFLKTALNKCVNTKAKDDRVYYIVKTLSGNIKIK